MARTIAIGEQDFGRIIEKNCFYIDKTGFIKSWWENEDTVTLITRPRRFGKTLTMNMLEYFFSLNHKGRSDLFSGLKIWEEEKYQKLQGMYPVIFLSFAGVKGRDYATVREKICQQIVNLYEDHKYLVETGFLQDESASFFKRVSADMNDAAAEISLSQLSRYLYKYYGKKVIILLDEYDTPMQEAFLNGFWKELSAFLSGLFNAAFKTNPYMERAVMTGITRVGKESIFSDLNNLKVITVTSNRYASDFGFTEDEVQDALEEYGLADQKEAVKQWYDGFRFGSISCIYNPWSVLNFLAERKLASYWVNTSSNKMIGELVRYGSREIKSDFEIFMQGGTIQTTVNEEIVFDQLNNSQEAVWSFLLASGYLKIVSVDDSALRRSFLGKVKYELALTNGEIQIMCALLVRSWFSTVNSSYSYFVQALLENNVKGMNVSINKISEKTFSYFDVGGESQAECFYHGFVLGLIAELADRYRITSNRESGDGRYDVMLEPISEADPAMILEFKTADKKDGENGLKNAVNHAWKQILQKKYEAELAAHGILREHIRIYGFAFSGKEVMIDGGSIQEFSL